MDLLDAFDFNDAPALTLRFDASFVLALAFLAFTFVSWVVVFVAFLAATAFVPAAACFAVCFVAFTGLAAGLTELANYY